MASDTSILDALKKLHGMDFDVWAYRDAGVSHAFFFIAGHYLHLPVVEAGAPIGLVDVMTLTISMLTYLVRFCKWKPKFSGTTLKRFICIR